MKKTMKTSRWIFGLLAASCALGMMLPLRATAQVSVADFNSLKEMVQKLSEQVQSLQQTNIIKEQIHEKDVEQLQQLQEKLAETQQIATNAEQKSIAAAAQAQTQPTLREPIDDATVNHGFMMLGDAEFQYVKAAGQHGAFVLADFAPIFLYHAGDNILLEAGFDTTLQNGLNGDGTHDSGSTTSFDLSFAQLDYVMNEYMTLCAGDLLLPLGTYSERSAGWLNKFPDDPLAVSLIPGSGVGAELQGGIPLGDAGALLNYQIYGVNGPSSSATNADPSSLDLGGNVGLQSNNSVANLHGSPVGGGRLGIFKPFKPHYDVELGISGQSGEWDDAGTYLWSAGVLDGSVHLGPNFQANGEYILTSYGSDQGEIHQQGWWVQSGYKLAGLDLELPLINNVELVGRYDNLHNAPGPGPNGLGGNTRRITSGFIYYFTNTLLLEGDYEFLHSNDPSQVDQFILQLSYGF
jgi:hypothetical protein